MAYSRSAAHPRPPAPGARPPRVVLRRLALVPCLLCALAAAHAAPPALPAVVHAVQAEVRPAEAMEYMRQVYSTDRWFTFPKFEETARYLQATLERLGLRDVELTGAPADGVTQAGFWTMPLAWDVSHARLELLDASAPQWARVLADYQQVPSSLGMWSGPTPPGGVTAELVAYDPQRDIRGKLVLTSDSPAGIKWLLARRGALGALNASTENPELREGRQWINAWGDNGWAFTKGSAPLLCFSITPRQADYLRGLLRQGRTVKVHAEVASRYYAGRYPYTTAVIPGTSPDEEVLTLGHTSEQGAEDNATGVAALVESMATLNRLIASGRLPRPRRSIRVLLMPEMYGTLHYISTHPERIRHTVAAMCVDTPAALYNLAGTEYTFNLNPHVASSYVDAFVLRVAREYLPGVKRPWHWHEYRSGTDAYLGEPTVDVPTTWPYSGSGVETHHNSEDTPDRVDARSLRDLAIINAAYLYYIAAAGEPEALWLAEVAERRGLHQIVRASAPFADRLAAAPSGRAATLAAGLEQIDYQVDREQQAVRSVLRLDPAERRQAAARALDPLLADLAACGRLQAAALRRAAGGIEPAAAPADPQTAAAARIVVRRRRFGTIPLDELAPDQREGYPSGAWSSVPATALYWCDGHRNLAEVMRLTRLELGPVKFDFVGYFQFLRKHGYVEFVQP